MLWFHRHARTERIVVNVKNTVSVDLTRPGLTSQKPVALSYSIKEAILEEDLGRDFYILDSVYLIGNKNKLIRFDRKTGEYGGSISRPGSVENEYDRLRSTWFKNDTLYIYDQNSKKILSYNINNEFYGATAVSDESSFLYLIPIDKGGFIGRKVFFQDPQSAYELAYYDDNYSFVKNIGNMKLSSPL